MTKTLEQLDPATLVVGGNVRSDTRLDAPLTALVPEDPRHGENAGYAAGCRALCCSRAHTRTMKRYRMGCYPGLVDSTGTIRRLQALMCLGWRKTDLGARLGVKDRAIGGLLVETRVQSRSAARVAKLYDEIGLQLGSSRVTTERARRNGWVSPLAWDDDTIDDPAAKPYRATGRDRELVDEVLIQRALSGQLVKANAKERRLIIQRWRAAGRSLAELERIQGWNPHRDLRQAS